MAIFLDTSFVIALELARDNNHASAVAYWKTYIQVPQALVTTDLIFVEIVTFLNARGLHQKAVEIGDRLLGSQLVEIIPTSLEAKAEAWSYFKRHADKQYSLADCTSFVTMRKRRITRALTFDAHFTQAGFTPIPQSANS